MYFHYTYLQIGTFLIWILLLGELGRIPSITVRVEMLSTVWNSLTHHIFISYFILEFESYIASNRKHISWLQVLKTVLVCILSYGLLVLAFAFGLHIMFPEVCIYVYFPYMYLYF